MLALLSQLANILIPVFACVAVGLVIARRGLVFPRETLGPLVLYVGAPCLVLQRLARVELTAPALLQLFGASLAVLVAFVIVYALCLRMLGLPQQTFLAPLVFSNCGNLGLPLTLFAFGEQGFGVSIAVFALWTMVQFTTADLFWSGRLRPRSLLVNPLSYAGPVGLLFALSRVPLPVWMSNTAGLLGDITVPLMLIMLGVSLHRLEVRELRRSMLLSVLRIALGGLIAYGIALLFHLTPQARAILTLHAAMPVAVANYIFAVQYERDPEQVASLVVVSTLLSAVTMPALFWLLL